MQIAVTTLWSIGQTNVAHQIKNEVIGNSWLQHVLLELHLWLVVPFDFLAREILVAKQKKHEPPK
jgi:hypothetical protein